MTIAAVVLAAGASTRLGEPKQLVTVGGETLLERAIRVAQEAGCSPVVVVLGAEAERVRARSILADVVLDNPGWQEGMASSIRLAISSSLNSPANLQGAVLMTCDQPAVTAEHLRALLSSGRVTASAYSGRRGVPAYFPAASFPALLMLTGDSGASSLLVAAPAIDLPGGELDIDTPLDLTLARTRFL